MSEIKVNKITPRTNCGTTQLGDSGDTFTVPAGATISNLGTATGFGGTGVVSWDTASIKTAGFVAVTGTGYFCNTTAGGFTVTLPASPSAGDVVGVADYAKTFDTATLTLGRNSENIGGVASDANLTTEGIAVTLVYVDSTKGWIVTDSGNQSDAPTPQYIAATGGCITTCGNFKIHTFFSPGTLCVSSVGNPSGSNTVSYMVVAGGGGGGVQIGGGAGAGGYRESKASSDCYTASPLNATCGAPGYNLPVSASPGAYPIVVGAGGAAGVYTPRSNGANGDVSTFSSITSAGGGFAASGPATPPGGAAGAGGSGGGGGGYFPHPGNAGAAGDTPPTTPAQGFDGGDGSNSPTTTWATGGGGGATAVGADRTGSNASGQSGPGGDGAGTAINLTTMPAPSPVGAAQIGTPGPSPSVRYFGGGGGGGAHVAPCTLKGVGGVGGGGDGTQCTPTAGGSGIVNTGGGGGGGGIPANGGAGGSGIVVVRYKYQ